MKIRPRMLLEQLTEFAVLAILLSVFSQQATAVGFLDALTYPAGNRAAAVTAADFNNDGHLDLATANLNGVSILLNRGDGTFGPPLEYAAGTAPTFIAAGDFNSDGNADLVVINQHRTHESNLSILLGNGDGTFQLPLKVLAGGHPDFIAAGDFNRDGRLDLAVTNPLLAGTVSLLIGNGDGTFQPPVAYAAGEYPTSVATADLNQDGKLDLAVTDGEFSGNNGAVSILLGNGDGTFQVPSQYQVGTAPVFVAIGDVNSDGRPDLAVANSNTDDNVSVLLGNGDGSFQAAVNYQAGWNAGPYWIVIADLNHDGIADLAVWAGGVRVMLGNRAGGFRPPIIYEAGGGSFSSMASGDFNSDGNLDFAIPDFGEAPNTATVAVLMGNGDGTLRSARDYRAGLWSLAVGDFNGDGKADFVTWSSLHGTAALTVRLGRGDGTFGAIVNSAATAFEWLEVADFNLDGKLDLVAPSNFCAPECLQGVGISLGNGDGTFQPTITSRLDYAPASVAVGDFNGDGKPDVAVSGVVILLGNGDGTLTKGATYTLPGTAWLAVGDFNSDGKQDLAVPNTNGLTVLLGNGDGTFQIGATSGAVNGYVVAADFNNDGKLDVAITNFGMDQVQILLGNGDGTFHPAQSYGTAFQPESLAVLDANGDGNQDLAVACIEGSSVSILLGNGDGTFRPAINYPVVGPWLLAVADFNGDGAPDLITGGVEFNVVLLNTGASPF